MAVEKLTEADLATSLSEVLERVRGGERFAIERNGAVIATLSPPSGSAGFSLRELAVELAELPRLDDDFGADIEAVRANPRPSAVPVWPD